ncbi:hypothetical protein ACHAXH_009977 [Discostella pseudostelligera]|jgi:tRNA pseudouridine(38-40) synthase
MRLHLHRYLYIIFICINYPSDRCVSSFLVPSTHSASSSRGRRNGNEQHTLSSSHLSKDEDTVGEVQPRPTTNLVSSSSKEFSNNYENADSTKTSKLVFETASRIVQHYLYLPEDVTNESRSSRPLLCRITENDDVTAITGNKCWADMFAPLYVSVSAPKISPPSIPKNENRMQQQPRKRRKGHRTNLKLTIAYRGQDFCGWEDQRHSIIEGGNATQLQLPSVQGMLVDILDPILGHEQQHGNETTTTKARPIEIKVAGRTDAGVSAIGQICRIRTWRLPPTSKDGKSIEQFVKDNVNDHVANHMRDNSPSLCIRSVECVDDAFHPTFGASCRAYAYLIDVNNFGTAESNDSSNEDEEAGEESRDDHTIKRQQKLSSIVLVQRLNALLRALEGKELDYIALSYGKVKSQTTLCTLHHARAHFVEWTGHSDGDSAPQKHRRAICIELVGDRFLRRMVRILVATAMREANRDAVDISAEVEHGDDDCHVGDDALLNIVLSHDREQRARAAPPDGLIFTGAAY